jgi:heptosyltransferase-3
VLLTPSLRLLKTWRPELRISVMIEFRFHELLQGNPCVDEVLHPRERGIEAILSMRQLRRRRFSLCVNLHGGPRSAFLSRYSGSKCKAGFEHFRNRAIYDFHIPDARVILGQPLIHTAEHQAAAFFWLGLPRQPIPASEIFPSEAARVEWRERLQALGIRPGREYAILQPTALYFTKEWPPELFARLGEYLEGSAGIAPIFSCGPGESARLDRVQQASQRPIRRLEGMSLGTFIAALEKARLYVGNDSGPAHMAAALGRPLVVIFGSSSSQIWRPWGGSNPSGDERGQAVAPHFRIVQNFYECNPCRGDRCYRFDRPQCILSITFEQVRSAIDSVLKQAPMGAWKSR